MQRTRKLRIDQRGEPQIVVVVGTVCVTAPLSFLGARLLIAERR